MKHKIVNRFEQGIVEVDLTDKELKYIQDIAKGKGRTNIMTSLSITDDEVEKIYTKFGLTNRNRDRDVQLVVVSMENKLFTVD